MSVISAREPALAHPPHNGRSYRMLEMSLLLPQLHSAAQRHTPWVSPLRRWLPVAEEGLGFDWLRLISKVEAPYLATKRAQALDELGENWLLHPRNAVRPRAPLPPRLAYRVR